MVPITIIKPGGQKAAPQVSLVARGGVVPADAAASPAPSPVPESRPAALLTLPGVGAGLAASAAALGWLLETLAQRGTQGLGNDFYIYWAAARLLGAGGNPYDVAAVNRLLELHHLQVTVSPTGYSYPAFFAVLLVPLGHAAPPLAFGIFTVLSLAAFGFAVALLAGSLTTSPWWEVLLVGALAGSFVPVRGSVFFGQANLLLLLPLALAWRNRRPGAWLGVAAAIKLYPAAALAALTARRRDGLASSLTGLGVATALIAVPNLVIRHSGGGTLFSLLAPDSYPTNESFNGALSRLASSTGGDPALLPGLPVMPAMVGLAVVTGALVAIVVLRRRGRPWAGCLALVLTWALLAAPKVSLWDLTPLLLPSCYCWKYVHRRPLPLLTLAAAWALLAAQASVYLAPSGPALTAVLLSSLGVLGTLLLGLLTAWVLWCHGDEDVGPT